MAGKFNAKFFNGEVFQKYIDRIPNPPQDRAAQVPRYPQSP